MYELLLSALLPKEWGQGDDPRPIPEGQELSAIMIDIQGSFSCSNFIEKIRHFYDSRKLYETTLEGDQQMTDEKKVTDDKHAFIK